MLYTRLDSTSMQIREIHKININKVYVIGISCSIDHSGINQMLIREEPVWSAIIMEYQ